MVHLRNKGKLQPAPQLNGLAEQVSAEVQAWPAMISATHWKLGDPTCVDGAEFHVEGKGELGHIHVSGEAHINLNESLRDQLVKDNLALPLIWDRAWVVAPITSPEEASQAVWLVRLGYDHLCSAPDENLSARIRSRALDRRQG